MHMQIASHPHEANNPKHAQRPHAIDGISPCWPPHTAATASHLTSLLVNIASCRSNYRTTANYMQHENNYADTIKIKC
jgi:hypothetical protein